jgi:hypothetical protein
MYDALELPLTGVSETFTDKGQTALFKDPVRTAL